MSEAPCLRHIAIIANEEKTTKRVARTAELNRMRVLHSPNSSFDRCSLLKILAILSLLCLSVARGGGASIPLTLWSGSPGGAAKDKYGLSTAKDLGKNVARTAMALRGVKT